MANTDSIPVASFTDEDTGPVFIMQELEMRSFSKLGLTISSEFLH